MHPIRVLLTTVMASALLARPAVAFKPKTHVWVGQQVLNDVAPDGKVTIAGREYAVRAAYAEALKKHPAEYRMGNIGPDAFPDVFVGQLTAHPGVKAGWQADDWLRHTVSAAAGDPTHLAFALGFLGHAAGDVFAHTYVNLYAGDAFDLGDGEQTVEQRHIALESFIELHTPPLTDASGSRIGPYDRSVAAPDEFVNEHLILSDDAQKQYRKVPLATHLVVMKAALSAARELERAVDAFEIELRTAIDAATALKLKVFTETEDLRKALDPIRLQFEQAKAAMAAHDVLIDAQIKIIDRGVSSLRDIERELARIDKLLDEANDEAKKVALRLVDAKAKLDKLPRKIVKEVCRKVVNEICKKKWGCLASPASCLTCEVVKKTVCKKRSVVNKAWNLLDDVRDASTKEQKKLVDRIAKLNTEARTWATRKGPIEAALTVARLEKARLDAMRTSKLKPALEQAYALYETARDAFDKKLKEMVKLEADFLSMSAVLTIKFNPVKEIIGLWRSDMEKAVLAYATTSAESARELLRKGGNPLSPYMHWKDCWLPVFIGVPSVVTRAGCTTVTSLDTAITKLDELHASVVKDLGIFGWVVAPTHKLKELLMPKAKEAALSAAQEVGTLVLGKEMTAFVLILGDSVNDERLDTIFSADKSGKKLPLFASFSSRVRSDMSVDANGFFSPSRFSAAANAVTLAKLSLLEPAELTKLVRDVSGDAQLDIYGQLDQNVLLGAVQSLDGNHQWMPIAPPYIRQGTTDYRRAHSPSYGRRDPGFPMWQNGIARKAVFTTLFSGPLHPTLTASDAPGYPYMCTSADPYGLETVFVQQHP